MSWVEWCGVGFSAVRWGVGAGWDGKKGWEREDQQDMMSRSEPLASPGCWPSFCCHFPTKKTGSCPSFHWGSAGWDGTALRTPLSEVGFLMMTTSGHAPMAL